MKKERKRRDRNGRGNEDQSESVKVFQAFFESICPHVKKCVPSYDDGLTFVD
jgi:hypothetical protein